MLWRLRKNIFWGIAFYYYYFIYVITVPLQTCVVCQ